MFGKLKRPAVVLLSCGALAACATSPKPVALAPNAVQMENLPTPDRADLSRPTPTFVIGPNDKLSVDVFGVEELQRSLTVDGAGMISYPLIGTVAAAGLTPAELASEIELRLAGPYVKDPQVTVNIEESRNMLVTVDGEVERPGNYPVAGRMTLLRAVATAGGTTDFSKLSDVVVQREVGGKTYLGLYNLDAIRRGNYPDLELYPADIVVVGDSRQRRLFQDLLQVLPVALTPLVLLLNNR